MSPSARSPRAPGLAHLSLLALLVVIAALTLFAPPQQPPPPPIAEFAPVVQQIKDPPPQQEVQQSAAPGKANLPNSGKGGNAPNSGGDGAAPSGSGSGSPAVRDDGVKRADVNRCVGNPPTQIEDPQSPPCVAFWKGNNGGATSRGVTADTITILWPEPATTHTYQPYAIPNEIAAMQRFFQSRFETYGRQVVSKFPNDDPAFVNPGCSRDGQQVYANQIAKETQTFASMWYVTCYGYYYNLELARQKVISITPQASLYDSRTLRANGPYLWQYPMAIDRMQQVVADWVCSRFGVANARHAGVNDVTDMSTQPRRYGILVGPNPDVPEPDVAPLLATLQSTCGIKVDDIDIRRYDESKNTPADISTAIDRWKNDDVTTVIVMGDRTGRTAGLFAQQATTQNYQPEWLISSAGGGDYNGTFSTAGASGWPRDQTIRIMGLTAIPRIQRIQNYYSYQAMAEGGEARAKDRPTMDPEYYNSVYRTLLVLYSGIQMAGPNLTPETFAAALERTEFSNPPSPRNVGKVGFDDTHAMTTDVSEFFWREDATNPQDNTRGALCYVDRGRRRGIGEFPKGDTVFFALDPQKPPCDSGAL